MSTPKAMEIGIDGEFVFGHPLNHGGDTFHLFLLVIEEGDSVFLDGDNVFNSSGFVGVLFGNSFLKVADNEETVGKFDRVSVQIFKSKCAFLCFC